LRKLAEELKTGRYGNKPLVGETLATIFMKFSTRTRLLQGRDVSAPRPRALPLAACRELGRGEPIGDTARVLSRYVDGTMIRTFAHEEAAELARHATVPVTNTANCRRVAGAACRQGRHLPVLPSP
jgi:ornithine carbamoyltransferase